MHTRVDWYNLSKCLLKFMLKLNLSLILSFLYFHLGWRKKKVMSREVSLCFHVVRILHLKDIAEEQLQSNNHICLFWFSLAFWLEWGIITSCPRAAALKSWRKWIELVGSWLGAVTFWVSNFISLAPGRIILLSRKKDLQRAFGQARMSLCFLAVWWLWYSV